MANRRVCIVFEESKAEGGKGFNMYLEGVSSEADDMSLEEQINKLASIDFWGLRCFEACGSIVKRYCGGIER